MQKTIFIYLFTFFFGASLFLSSCSSDDAMDKVECPGVAIKEGSISINGQTHGLTASQMLANGGLSNTENYLFQLAGIKTDCSEMITFNLNVQVMEGASIARTYDLKDFFDAKVNDAHGGVAFQRFSPVSQSLVDIKSGTLKIEDHGDKEYSFTINASLVGGDSITADITTKL